MPKPTNILLVRFKSRLPHDDVMKVVEERLPDFRALPGLQQKFYLQEPETGEYAGLYLWESGEALRDFSESELRATIAKAYQVEGTPRIEVYGVVQALRDEAPRGDRGKGADQGDR